MSSVEMYSVEIGVEMSSVEMSSVEMSERRNRKEERKTEIWIVSDDRIVALPTTQLPLGILGFHIKLSYYNKSVSEFLCRSCRIVDSVTVTWNMGSGGLTRIPALLLTIWDWLTIVGLDLNETIFRVLRGMRNSVLTDCSRLKAIRIIDWFIEFPTDNRVEATNNRLLCHWLFTQHSQRPKLIMAYLQMKPKTDKKYNSNNKKKTSCSIGFGRTEAGLKTQPKTWGSR
uniref:Uncharacterized protein n=1 Tax=Globodera rostochiensis TaxID=31243 RepID=A0A914H2P4_GLORO